jgi:hypothetical protein
MKVLLLHVGHQIAKMEMLTTSSPNIKEEKCVKIKQKLNTHMVAANVIIES